VGTPVHRAVGSGLGIQAGLAFLALSLSPGLSLANPTGGEVVAGTGNIRHTSATRLDVKQTSERLGIEWRDFSIGRGEQVNFDQPSRSAIALNRVTGTRVSNIEGLLTANGNVFLVNRNGVIFYKSAVVDVGGLLATTADIANQDFLSGRYEFNRNVNPEGRVVNEGDISVAEGGLVALVAPSVRNAGNIHAHLGRVALAAGNAFTLDLFGDRLVSFAVDDQVARRLTGLDGETIEALVEQSGTIEAPGGRVWLSAQAAKGVVDKAINVSGVVRARTVASREGRIVLAGGGAGSVEVSGTLEAGGSSSETGGEIEILGASIRLAAGATVDASGGSGGGTILVGGDLRGQGTRQRASHTTVEAGAAVRADATVNGDGGTIVIWSEEHTGVDGGLSAQGGPAGGDGGLIETSSRGELVFSTSVKVSAPGGRAGTWLLDPEDIDIGRGQADAIEATLNEGGNVSIETADGGDGEGNIAVNASITKTDGDDARLSMTAHGRIDVNQPIRSEAGKLEVSLKAGRDVNVKAGVDTNGGRFSTRVTGVQAPKPEPEPLDTDDEVAETAEVDGPADTGDTNTAEALTDIEGTDLGDGQDQEAGNEEVKSDTGNSINDPNPESVESTEHVAATAAPPKADSAKPAMPMIRVEDTVATKGGDISVDAGETGVSFVIGTLDASNLDEGRTGGDIEVLGEHVVVAGDALVDASGEAGGGDIHIGGDYQGEGERHNAETTTIGKRVVIRSDATGEGDAGTVVVWADGSTQFSGHISARGGPEGGDGGTVEVSGKTNLGFRGTVDAAAPAGETGSLLLDPETLTVVDRRAGGGDHDLNMLCTVDTSACWFPPGSIISGLWTPEAFESLGIDPFPETERNTLSWGRLMQLAETTLGPTPFNLRLEAERDVTFAALNGTVSTRGSPAGGNSGWTVTLNLQPPYDFFVRSNHGDIVFEDRSDNLAVRGGNIRFIAPEGRLRLGNLYTYSLNPDHTLNPFLQQKIPSGTVALTAGGNISVGTINTRYEPYRYADPATGAPQPQPLLIADTSTFDPDAIPLAALTDLGPGGHVSIVSNGGSIRIRGPVFTATGDFFASSAGSFRAGIIDTGSARVIVKHSVDDPGSLNTLSTGERVEIIAERIEFDRIHAGTVDLAANPYGLDAITGMVVFDNFRQSDFIGNRPESAGFEFRDPQEAGLVLTVGDTDQGDCTGNCIDNLAFDLRDVGIAASQGLNTGDVLDQADTQLGLDGTVQLNLDTGFSLAGGDFPDCVISGTTITCQPLHVPPAFEAAEPSQGAVAIGVPLPVTVPLGAAAGGAPPGGTPPGLVVVFIPTPMQPTPTGGSGQPGAGGMMVTFSSSADVERIRNEGEENKTTNESEGCPDEDNLQWLEQGPRSAARDLDWGRRSNVGTGPENMENVFKPASCYFAG
jgi:filamentous hemagglutinin family protein